MRIAFLLLLLVLIASPGVASEPEIRGWSYRAQFKAYSGAQPRQEQVVEQDVDFDTLLIEAGALGDFDSKSPRVTRVEGDVEIEVPSRFFPAKDRPTSGRLCWLRSGTMPADTQETIYVYFDTGNTKPVADYPQLKDYVPSLGPNLLANPGMETNDSKTSSRIWKWQYQARGEAGTVDQTHDERHSGKSAVRISNEAGGTTSVSVVQDGIKVEAGRRYVLSGWVKQLPGAKGGIACLTAWYSADSGASLTGPAGTYGNYKNSIALNVVGQESSWTYLSQATVNVWDPSTKANRPLQQDKLLPATTTSSVNLEVIYGPGTVLFDDIELRQLDNGFPVAIWLVGIEKL